MRFLKKLFILSMCFSLVAFEANADSLWTGITVQKSSLFVDQAGPNLSINDIVVVLIDEATSAKSDADTSADVEDSVSGSISNWFSLENVKDVMNLLLLNNSNIKTRQNNEDNLPAWGLEINNEFSGEGETTRNNSVVATISTRVVAIEPNGNVVLEGKKHISVNEETTILTVTGIARAEDISSDNTVLSSVIADLNFAVDGKGIIEKVNQRGFLSWFMGLLR